MVVAPGLHEAAAPSFAKWRNDAITLGVDAKTYDKILDNWESIQAKYAKQIK